MIESIQKQRLGRKNEVSKAVLRRWGFDVNRPIEIEDDFETMTRTFKQLKE